jgi:hypothetical protein
MMVDIFHIFARIAREIHATPNLLKRHRFLPNPHEP